MATTQFFDETLKDKERDISMDVEFGRSSFYNGENLVYLKVSDKLVILDEKAGRALCSAMRGLAQYLGYDDE